jgi:hypothetical protein
MTRSLPACAVLFTALSLEAAPPVSLLDQYLYFDEGLEDYLVFVDGTTGEVRTVGGDADPFTYTYEVTGGATAKTTVRRAADRYDVWTLTWTGAGTGTFVREEYRDDELDDTDTGRFIETSGSTAPPSGLTDVRLEETIDGEDERLEFLTSNKGREFEPGDVDPFTYTYSATDPVTAYIVATYRAGDYDEFALTFESDTAGTYLLGRFRDGEFVKNKRGQFRLAPNTQTVDVLIGATSRSLRGQNFFNLTGRNQTTSVTLRSGRPKRLRTEIENDGSDDRLSARAARGSSKQRTRYYSVSPRRNITARLTAGGLAFGEVRHGARKPIEIEVRRKSRKRGKSSTWLQGRSDVRSGAADRAVYQVSFR